MIDGINTKFPLPIGERTDFLIGAFLRELENPGEGEIFKHPLTLILSPMGRGNISGGA